jgi:hypothetical protein
VEIGNFSLKLLPYFTHERVLTVLAKVNPATHRTVKNLRLGWIVTFGGEDGMALTE